MRYFLYCRKSTDDDDRQVLSLESQREAVGRVIATDPNIQIAEVFEESRTAKSLGRPIFAAMLARIQAGEADGIVSWAPDRLARNSIDGGRIVYMLDTGALRDLKFATYTFENNSQGKFMLSIMFGQSKYYSDALSENVKRGNRTKLEHGWRPNRAPLGYRNNPINKTIEPDPVHFALIQRMFQMVLYEGMNPRQITRIARDEWGFLTPRGPKSGGTPLGRTTIYHTLSNPFYMGIIEWGGETYAGKHQPMLSPEDFARVQAKLAARSAPRTVLAPFAYTGLVRCGSCGTMITAETKRRAHRNYVYYHCTGRGALRSSCPEPSIRVERLELQFCEYLSSLRIQPEIQNWACQFAREQQSSSDDAASAKKVSRETALQELSSQAAELTSLRLRRMVSDQEFLEAKRELDARRTALQTMALPQRRKTLIEQVELVILALRYAGDWLRIAENHEKRILLKIIGSNITLMSKKVSIQAMNPFCMDSKNEPCLSLLGDMNANRQTVTLPSIEYPRPALTPRQISIRGRKLVQSVMQAIDTEQGCARLDDLADFVKLMGERGWSEGGISSPQSP